MEIEKKMWRDTLLQFRTIFSQIYVVPKNEKLIYTANDEYEYI